MVALGVALAPALAALAACDGAGPADDSGVDARVADDGAAVDGATAEDGAVAEDGGARDGALDGSPSFDASVLERCLPQAVGGEGACTDLLGVQWNGAVCADLHGCSCTGADCPGVYGTYTECWAERRGCPGLCASQHVTPVGAVCDVSWGPYWRGSAGCESFVACDCTGEDCDRPYPDKPACERANRGCMGRCGPEDAAGSGTCATDLGVVWNGTVCVPITGCTCAGADCGDLYASIEDCAFAHRGCAP